MSINQLSGTRFGSVEYLNEDVIEFDRGMIGFDHLTHFLIVSHKPESKFRWLQSIEEPAIAFLVADPSQFIDGYSVEIEDEDTFEMQITAETSMMLLTTVSIPKGEPDKLTLNLAGPIVINLENRQGRQFVVETSSVTLQASQKQPAVTAA
ncbi:MAG: flagellar assembly protein FliW [Fimbriimonadaceae bacterium]|nr:flagellar assembly protein FliW [Fimbriimonadaceae bacterium]